MIIWSGQNAVLFDGAGVPIGSAYHGHFVCSCSQYGANAKPFFKETLVTYVLRNDNVAGLTLEQTEWAGVAVGDPSASALWGTPTYQLTHQPSTPGVQIIFSINTIPTGFGCVIRSWRPVLMTP